MAYHVQFLPAADKGLGKLPRKIQARIVEAAEGLADNPRPHGFLKLTGYSNAYRIRVGDYRIVYTIDDAQRIVEVSIVADRKDVYRKR